MKSILLALTIFASMYGASCQDDWNYQHIRAFSDSSCSLDSLVGLYDGDRVCDSYQLLEREFTDKFFTRSVLKTVRYLMPVLQMAIYFIINHATVLLRAMSPIAIFLLS
jgi:hypothetical protein